MSQHMMRPYREWLPLEVRIIRTENTCLCPLCRRRRMRLRLVKELSQEQMSSRFVVKRAIRSHRQTPMLLDALENPALDVVQVVADHLHDPC